MENQGPPGMVKSFSDVKRHGSDKGIDGALTLYLGKDIVDVLFRREFFVETI